MTSNDFLNISDSNVVYDNNHMSDPLSGLCDRNKTVIKEYNQKVVCVRLLFLFVHY